MADDGEDIPGLLGYYARGGPWHGSILDAYIDGTAYPRQASAAVTTGPGFGASAAPAQAIQSASLLRQGWNRLSDWATSPDVTNALQQTGNSLNRWGDYGAIGAAGLGAMGAEAPAAAGFLSAGLLDTLGYTALVGSDYLAGKRKQALTDALGAVVNRYTPPTVDARPQIDNTLGSFGF